MMRIVVKLGRGEGGGRQGLVSFAAMHEKTGSLNFQALTSSV